MRRAVAGLWPLAMFILTVTLPLHKALSQSDEELMSRLQQNGYLYASRNAGKSLRVIADQQHKDIIRRRHRSY